MRRHQGTTLKGVLKARLPILATVKWWFIDACRRRQSMRTVFTEIYRTQGFGESASVSGPGSDLVNTTAIRAAIPRLLQDLRVRSLLDAPCGDGYWVNAVPLPVERYIGVDIVPDMIRQNQHDYEGPGKSFQCLDLTTDPLPCVDLILCRDCLVHMSFQEAVAVIRNFKRSGSRYLLTTTFSGLASHSDIVKGRWRPLNLQLPPFGFPAPQRIIQEYGRHAEGLAAQKCLGLWELTALEL